MTIEYEDSIAVPRNPKYIDDSRRCVFVGEYQRRIVDVWCYTIVPDAASTPYTRWQPTHLLQLLVDDLKGTKIEVWFGNHPTQ